MSKILLITNNLGKFPGGGRELLCNLNFKLLKDIYDNRLLLFELPRAPSNGLKSIINAFWGHIDGLNNDSMTCALHKIQTEKIEKVFIDGSNLGGLSKKIKKEFPQVEVITFYHNVEAKFFWDSFKHTRTLRALAVLAVNYLAERKSVKYSDKRICLSERDSNTLGKLYGRTATHISPIAMEDQVNNCKLQIISPPLEKFILFVGGNFYANRYGISWFVKNVVPHLSIKTCIVGKGLEDLRPQLEIEGKVEVVGEVDSLTQWYCECHLVVAPIFDGSGMKTKVAEALMYGKKIVGTPEAFVGYEIISDYADWVCSTAYEFVEAINRFQEMTLQLSDSELRALYQKNYSFTAARSRFENILDSVS